MSPLENHIILKYRIMITLFLIDEVFHTFRKAWLDTFGEHTIYCKELSRFKYRHDFVKNVLFNIFQRARGIYEETDAYEFFD